MNRGFFRNEDGSVGKIRDSLMTAFKTKAGRTVYDGGGVMPDVYLGPQKYSPISLSLLNKNLIFDYATQYRMKHDKIAAVKDFKIEDADFADFENFLSDKEYDYTTKSEKTLEELKKNSEDEKYFDNIKSEFDALKIKMMH